MSEEHRRIMKMFAEKKISLEEAERLLEAISESSGESQSGTESTAKTTSKSEPKYLRIEIEPKDSGRGRDRVNIKVPLLLVKAGMKLGSILPGEAGEKINSALGKKGINIDVRSLNPDSLNEVLNALKEMSIDVDDEKETVRIYCE